MLTLTNGSKAVSRVMSCVIIYLGRLLPDASSNQPGTRRAALTFTFGLASDGVYMAASVTSCTVVSYTAFPPLPHKCGGIFLLHCPGSRLHRPLAGILPCEARTFLSRQKPAAITYFTSCGIITYLYNDCEV